MGRDITKEHFDEEDYARFGMRLDECLRDLRLTLDQAGFGVGPATIGAELELFLVDGAGRSLPENQAVCTGTADHRVTFELSKFNLELNATPTPLARDPFSTLGGELESLLLKVEAAASRYGGRIVMIGILPTLTHADLGPEMVTDTPRYRALINGLRQLRQDAVHIKIDGDDPLELNAEDVTLEGANRRHTRISASVEVTAVRKLLACGMANMCLSCGKTVVSLTVWFIRYSSTSRPCSGKNLGRAQGIEGVRERPQRVLVGGEAHVPALGHVVEVLDDPPEVGIAVPP